MTIEQLLEDFCHYAKYIRGVSDNTLKRYRCNIRYFARASEISRISDVNEKKVLRFFLNGRVQNKWKSTTYRTYFMSLLVFFRWCVKHEYMTHNMVENVEIPKMSKHLPSRISQQQAELLLEVSYNYPYTQKYLRHRNRAIIAMFLFAGLRKNELLSLPYANVNMEELSIIVRGKGDKERIIPICSSLAKVLNGYLTVRKKNNKTCPQFFTSSNRNQGFTESGLKRMMKLMMKTTGVTFKTHGLRHTFATLMLEGGCDLFTLSKLMGHSDIKTTSIYLSASAEHSRNEIFKHPLNQI